MSEKEKRISCYEHLIKLPTKDLLQDVIDYLSHIKEQDWCVDVVRTKDQKQNCFLGHLFNFGGNLICSVFESGICNEYMYYDINDGKNPKYPQESPKKRITAYLENLRDGKEKTIEDYMKEI